MAGQTCIVANTATATITRQNADGTWTFVIPRPLHGGTIIGGTKEERDQESSPRPETRRKLLEAGAKAFPELLDADGKFRVIRDIVGRRPSRTGGMRLESEDLGNGRRVIHAYGAGGRGVEMSRGVAENVLDLIKEGRETDKQKSKL
jgi:glycine/D-amino acid oxidase-like deaminating enzyme